MFCMISTLNMSEEIEELDPSNTFHTGRTIDSEKKLLLWLLKTKSDRLTLRQNTKGKNRHVWRQFSIAYVDNIEQPYAMCSDCDTFVKYSGRTGTGGLVRHHCYRQNFQAKSEQNADPQKAEEVPGRARQDIEELIRTNSPRVGFVPNFKGKSDVWAQFDIITLDNNVMNYAACKQCKSIVTYVSRTGTGGMTRHRCQRSKRSLDDTAIEDLVKRVKVEVEDSESPPPDLTQLHIKAFSHLLQANLQTFSGKEERRSPPPADAVRRQYVTLLRRSLDVFHAMRNDAFFELAQTLVNLGAEYGKIDIKQVLMETVDLNTVFHSD